MLTQLEIDDLLKELEVIEHGMNTMGKAISRVIIATAYERAVMLLNEGVLAQVVVDKLQNATPAALDREAHREWHRKIVDYAERDMSEFTRESL